jgi:hypothetical protein
MQGHGNRGKKLTIGLLMMAVFTAVLILMFLPLFGKGNNGLNHMDALYNSISKASAYYIPQVQEEAERFAGKQVELQLAFPPDPKRKLPPETMAANAAKLLGQAGARVEQEGHALKVAGGLDRMISTALADADAMFHNRGGEVARRYGGADPKAMLYSWWQTLAAMQKSLNKQELFAEASFLDRVNKKAVETAYNYYGVEPQNIGDRWGIVLFSLVFYVVYTVWYGYGVMYLFEGAGFQLESH